MKGFFFLESLKELQAIGTKNHDSRFFGVDFYTPFGFPVRHLLEFSLGMVK